MAMRFAKLIALSETQISAFRLPLIEPNVAAFVFSRLFSNNCTSQNTGEDSNIGHDEFQKWCNGGGLFHKSACIDPSARIEMGALMHSDSFVGANVYVGSGSIVGPSVSIGQFTRTGYNVVLSNCMIGDFCVIHHGVCIGQDGFGFFVDDEGLMVKKPQCKIVSSQRAEMKINVEGDMNCQGSITHVKRFVTEEIHCELVNGKLTKPVLPIPLLLPV